MELHIVGQHLEVTDALKLHISEKLGLLEKKFSRITEIRVSVHIDKNDQIAEANVYIDGVEIHASATSPDLYHSVDLLVDKLSVQITKHKEKLIDSHR